MTLQVKYNKLENDCFNGPRPAPLLTVDPIPPHDLKYFSLILRLENTSHECCVKNGTLVPILGALTSVRGWFESGFGRLPEARSSPCVVVARTKCLTNVGSVRLKVEQKQLVIDGKWNCWGGIGLQGA